MVPASYMSACPSRPLWLKPDARPKPSFDLLDLNQAKSSQKSTYRWCLVAFGAAHTAAMSYERLVLSIQWPGAQPGDRGVAMDPEARG